MNIALLQVQFHLAGCNSLKEKRSRLASLKDTLGRQLNIAVCESGHHDDLRLAQWAFVAAATSSRGLDRVISGIETKLQQLDAVVTDIHREAL